MCDLRRECGERLAASIACAKGLFMEDFEELAASPSAQAPAPRRSGRRRLLLGGLVLTVALSLGVGAFLGLTFGASQAQAAIAASGGAPGSLEARLTPTHTPVSPTAGTGTPGPCSGDMTVTRVSGRTIAVKRPDGSTAVVHVGSRTHYTRSGQTVTESAVKVGSKIYVVGSCTSHGGSITATSVQIIS